MRIVTWNCNGAFRKKFNSITSLNADILVIQECENPELSKDDLYKKWASNYLWIGDNKNKGLGVFCKPNIKIKKLNWSNTYIDHTVKYFLPCSINEEFTLLGLWAHHNNSPNFGYIGQFWKYFQINHSNFNNIMIAGDLNSNAIWDQWDRWWNHTDVINSLSIKGIKSVYHLVKNESQGKETIPTFYLQRKLEKPYHIDYFFISDNFQDKLQKFEIKEENEWLEVSDHRPLFMDISI